MTIQGRKNCGLGPGHDDSRKKELWPRAGSLREFEEADLIFFRNAGGLRHFSIGSSTSAAFSSALMLHFVCITPDPTGTLGTYGCVWLSSDPVPRPASALGRRTGPTSESAFRVSESESRSGRSSELPGSIRVSKSESWLT